jgi:hypothetical protein
VKEDRQGMVDPEANAIDQAEGTQLNVYAVASGAIIVITY